MTEDWLFYLWTGIIIGYFACGVSFGNFTSKKEDNNCECSIKSKN